MIQAIALTAAGAVAALFGFAATRPDSFRLERKTRINAPPDKVFAHINDFHQWTGWSPWEHVDADLKRTYSGPTSGTGAVYEWEGKKTGMGRMEITSAKAAENLTIQLDFLKPWKARNTAEFSMTPQGSSTDVTWAMYGPSPFMSKVMGVFISMDKMVGKDFEKGLANLKRVSEA